MVLCLLSRDSHGDTGKLNHEETVRGPEIAIFPEKSEILLLILVKILKKSDSDFLRKGFLRDCRGRGYQPLQRAEPGRWRLQPAQEATSIEFSMTPLLSAVLLALR